LTFGCAIGRPVEREQVVRIHAEPRDAVIWMDDGTGRREIGKNDVVVHRRHVTEDLSSCILLPFFSGVAFMPSMLFYGASSLEPPIHHVARPILAGALLLIGSAAAYCIGASLVHPSDLYPDPSVTFGASKPGYAERSSEGGGSRAFVFKLEPQHAKTASGSEDRSDVMVHEIRLRSGCGLAASVYDLEREVIVRAAATPSACDPASLESNASELVRALRSTPSEAP
jgi:hypothetical protein